MTDIEFDLLDELYFIIDFKELSSKQIVSKDDLSTHLWELYQKGWINIYKEIDIEIFEIDRIDFEKCHQNLFFLASKEGLMKHNLG